MNKKALAPLLLIPLILIGLIAFYFILKALIGVVITVFFWTLALAVLVFLIYALYLFFRWLRRRK